MSSSLGTPPVPGPSTDGPVAHAPDGAPAAPAPPPSRVLLAALAVAVVGTNAGLMPAAVLTLSLKATAIAPDDATTVLSVAAGVASVFALVGYPLLGRLSDRTTGRWGRRRPWLVLGALLMAAGAVGVLASTTVLALTCAYSVLMLGSVSSLVAASAVVPDQIAPEHRGLPSTVVGLGIPVGTVVGLFLAQLAPTDLTVMILLPSAVGTVAPLVLAAVVTDPPLDPASRPPLALRDLVGTYWVSPRTSPAFGWAWLSRFLLFMGVGTVNAYQAFYLIMVLHVSTAAVAGQIFVATLVLTVTSMVFAPLAGRLSDASGRRKPFVIGSAVVFAVGLALVSQAHDFTTFLLAVAVMGLGQGVYFAVDFALVTQVLPDPANPGKDLGIMNLANNLPASVVPVVAPSLLALGATASSPQNFTALFVAGAVCAVCGALAVLPVRGVR